MSATAAPLDRYGGENLNQILSIKTLAQRWDMEPQTIYNWRHQGYGPPSFKAGALVRYRLKDVLAWEEAQLAKEGH